MTNHGRLLKKGICLTLCLGLMASVSPPSKAGILESLDTLMKNEAKRYETQGDAAWAVIMSVWNKPPDGSSRAKEFDKAFKGYADSYHVGVTAADDLKAFVKELLKPSNYIPGFIKAAWGSITKTAAGLKARFLSRMEKPFDDAAAEAAYNAATGGGGGGATMITAEPPAPVESAAPEPPQPAAPPKADGGKKDDAAAPPPNPLSSAIYTGTAASGTYFTSQASATETGADEDVFSSFVKFQYQAGQARHLVATQVTDSSARAQIMPTVNYMYDDAGRMEDQLASAIVAASENGKDSLGELNRFMKKMKPGTSSYYLKGLVTKVSQQIKGQGKKSKTLDEIRVQLSR